MEKLTVLFLRTDQKIEGYNEWDICKLAYNEIGWEEAPVKEVVKVFSFHEKDLTYTIHHWFTQLYNYQVTSTIRDKLYRVYNEYGGIVPPEIIMGWIEAYDPAKYHRKKCIKPDVPEYVIEPFKGGNKNNCWKDHRLI
jgi:hypothetical protein